MQTVADTGNRKWIHITDPDESTIRELAREYDIHLQTAEELLSENISGKADLFPGYIYIVLRFPYLIDGTVDDYELDCVVSEDVLVSVSYESVPVITEIISEMESDRIRDHKIPGDHAGYLLYFLLEHLYTEVHDAFLSYEHRLNELEENVFSGNHRAMVEALAELSRTFVDTRQILSHHTFVLPSLEAAGKELFDDSFQYQLHQIKGEFERTMAKLKQLKETLKEVRNTNNSLLATRQNEVMKIFTIMAFLTLPLSLIASVFSMKTETMPVVGQPYDFWIITGAMLLLVIVALSYFRYKDLI